MCPVVDRTAMVTGASRGIGGRDSEGTPGRRGEGRPRGS